MNTKYEIIIFWSAEDNAFVAEVPELPGCMADGNSYQEAVSNAEHIIQEWIDTATELGRSIPDRGVDSPMLRKAGPSSL